MLFQEKRRQLLPQQARQVLAFGEGDQLILVGLREHALERLRRPQQPALAQGFPVLPAQK